MFSLKNSTDVSARKNVEKLKCFNFTGNSCVKTSLGVNFERTDSGLHLSQPYLISRSLDIVALIVEDNSVWRIRDTPDTRLYPIKDTNGELTLLPWSCRSVIGMLNYISGSVCLGIEMVLGQNVRFVQTRKKSMER